MKDDDFYNNFNYTVCNLCNLDLCREKKESPHEIAGSTKIKRTRRQI